MSTTDSSSPVVLVVGASSDIGVHLALELADYGATVLAGYHSNASRLEECMAQAETKPGRIEPVPIDVMSLDSLSQTVDSAVERHGKLDAMVVMSGKTRDNFISFMSEEEWDDVQDLNLKGAFLACKAAARPMMVQRHGRIILVSSLSGVRGVAGQSNYCAAKAGLTGLTRSLTRELARFNVLINIVAPGLVESTVNDEIRPDQREALLSGVALGRVARKDEITPIIRFLALDPGATYIAGQVLCVDGGVT